MGIRIQLISLILGVLFLYFVFRFVKRNTFRPSYAFMWILVAFFLVSIPLLERFYKWIATYVIGISDARHIIYVVLIGFLLVYIFHLTIRISKMNDQIQELISYTAILEKEIKEEAEEAEEYEE
jgi:hypothetical protein